MRVSVYNTVGANESVIEFTGTTKSDLCAELAANNISFRDMSMTVGETQVTLDSPNAITPTAEQLGSMNLPSDSWTLFLLPVEVKSGFDDFDNDDYEFENAEIVPYEGGDVEESILSPENLAFIKDLEAAKASIDKIIARVRAQKITDPRTLALSRQAAILQASIGRR